jgi:hypothetical protein
METNQKKSQHLFTRIAIPCKPNYSLLEKTYRKNQLIVTFGKIPSDEEVKEVKGYFNKMGIKKIKKVKCNCNMPVQLWLAKDIHTIVSGNGVKAGTGPGTKTVGESYALNFLSKIPRHHWGQSKHYPYKNSECPPAKEEIITIAVLDTGIDLSIVDGGYISNNYQNKPGYECFGDAVNGWNFVDDNANIKDDNPGLHGSLVTQFIINQFKNSTKSVKIIPLKTHDRNGKGDLFKIFCAIYYAIAKGAKIINASWGFYHYEEAPVKQLNALIATLKDEGILFVTAAGNQSDADDKIARGIFAQQGINPSPFQLRNLAIHHFLPANLSKSAENLITATTSNGEVVAATENHSNVFVDLGVLADKSEKGDLLFEVPFNLNGAVEYVRGSSFATAIATGIIGANCDTKLYTRKTINKQSFIKNLFDFSENARGVALCKKFAALEQELIKDGVCVQKHPDI